MEWLILIKNKKRGRERKKKRERERRRKRIGTREKKSIARMKVSLPTGQVYLHGLKSRESFVGLFPFLFYFFS